MEEEIKENIEHEVVETEQEKISEQPDSPPTKRELAELEVYARHMREIRAELEEIHAKFGIDGEELEDPLKEMREELAEIKNGFSKMRSFFNEIKNQQVNHQQAVSQCYYPTQSVSPMPQPAPVMPFYQTPNFQPIIPAIPNFNIR